MRYIAAVLFVGAFLTVAALTSAQPPGQPPGKDKGGKGGPGGPGGRQTSTVEEMVARMMTFDKNGDGKLTKEEVTDARLHPLFERADANKDGVVTKEELTALFTKELAALGSGGPGGPGGFGPPPIGQIMPGFVQDQLKLTAAQKKDLEALQKDVDAQIEKLLTDDQKKAYKEMKERGPGPRPGGLGGNPPPPPPE
jgi:Spy/CpxP family protein refolding chaperone